MQRYAPRSGEQGCTSLLEMTSLEYLFAQVCSFDFIQSLSVVLCQSQDYKLETE